MCEEIINDAKALCEKFINKVESGRARSTETYSECKSLLQKIIDREDFLKKYDIEHPTRKVDISSSVGKTYSINDAYFMEEYKGE